MPHTVDARGTVRAGVTVKATEPGHADVPRVARLSLVAVLLIPAARACSRADVLWDFWVTIEDLDAGDVFAINVSNNC